MTHPHYSELDRNHARAAQAEYRDGLVGQPLPCGCVVDLGPQARICDDPCHTAWNIAYRNERLNVTQAERPIDHLREYLGSGDPKLVTALKRGSRRGPRRS